MNPTNSAISRDAVARCAPDRNREHAAGYLQNIAVDRDVGENRTVVASATP
jgi:hypothetical protein